jgi:DNA-binding CsgD family transcriptional regulator
MAGTASHLRLLSNRDETLTSAAGLGDLVELYRAAQRLRTEDFVKSVFDWLRRRIAFDQGIIAMTQRGQAWADAHFSGIADPRALMESHARVRHLELQGQKLVANPGRAQRFSDLNLERGKAREGLGIAVSRDPGEVHSVVMLVRERRVPFAGAGKQVLEGAARHLVEALAVNRTCWLLNHGGANQESRPLALVNADGRFLCTTAAFRRLFWGAHQPDTAFIEPAALRLLSKGLPYRRSGSEYTVYGDMSQDGGFLLRLRLRSELDTLSAREGQIARLYARGSSYKQLAEDLRLAPSTVRNHLQNIYAKLRVSDRDSLIALLERQTL